jgi:hypothetical protein
VIVFEPEVSAAQSTFRVSERTAHDGLDVRLAERAQREHAHPRQQRRIYLEGRILSGRADERYRAVFGVRQHRVLLGFVPAMHLVDEQYRALVWDVAGLVYRLAQVGHPGGDRRHRDKPRLREAGDDFRQGGLAGAGRPPEDHARDLVGFECAA